MKSNKNDSIMNFIFVFILILVIVGISISVIFLVEIGKSSDKIFQKEISVKEQENILNSVKNITFDTK